MVSEETLPPPSPSESSRRKHRRSPEKEGEEGGSKRRKRHHHHHHSRHRHRHRRQHDESKPREETEEQLSLFAVSSSGLPKPDLDDREEGEIREDEDEELGIGKDGGALEAGMDAFPGIEPVESKPDSADGYPDDLAIPGEDDIYSSKVSRGLSLDIPQVRSLGKVATQSLGNCGSVDHFHGISNCKDAIIVHTKEGSENYTLEDRESDQEISFHSSRNLASSDGEYDKEKPSRPREPPKGTHRDLEDQKLNKHSESRDECDSIVQDQDLEQCKLRRHLESADVHKSSSGNMKISVSPETSRDLYKATARSPSYNKYEGHRDRSRSLDYGRERPYEKSAKSFDFIGHTNSLDSRDRLWNESDHERGSRHIRVDYNDSMNRTRDTEADRVGRRERERSRSYGRHDAQENRNGSQDRDRGRSREWDDARDRDRAVTRGRAGHRDRDRYEDREKSMDLIGERERERLRANDMKSDKERNRMDNDRDRDRKRDRDRVGNDRDNRDRGRDRDRDRETNRDGERDIGWQMERLKIRSQGIHRDSRHPKYEEPNIRRDKTRAREPREEVHQTKNYEPVKEKLSREEDEEVYQDKIEQQLAEQEKEDPEKIIEESRKRRLAILEKYKHRQPEKHTNPPENQEKEEMVPVGEGTKQSIDIAGQPPFEGPVSRHDTLDTYVPTSFSMEKSPLQNGNSAAEIAPGAGGLGDGTPKSERSADMFCDDIFGESPAGVRKSGKEDNLQVERSALHDNWDDAEGYYSYRFGELLDGRYEIISAHGKGVFSTVVRAKDLKAGKDDPEEVAIKIIRNNDTMYKAGLEELIILKKLVGADPDDKRHCVRFLSSFKYRNHLCLVFESLHMNLREVLKKFGRNIGLKLTAVRAYAKQLFIALKHLRNCGVLHCDIKPDNMLVNEAKNLLKLCDFGNAMFAGKNEITPYLVSRFYRAPEIILGLPYDHPLDIWSVGCCLYELYSGKVLFPGPSNNDMLRLHMELKGSFPKKMLRKGAFTDQHFDQDLNFHATEEDPVTKKIVKRLLLNIKPKDIGALIKSSPGEDSKLLAHFKDLLERIFVLDPEKRMTVSQALSHPFITGK